MPQRVRLGDVLLRAGVISQEQLDRAIARQSVAEGPRPRLGAVLARLGYATDDEIGSAVAEQLGLPYIDLTAISIDAEVASSIPQRLSEHYMMVLLERSSDGGLVVAMADPTNIVAIDDIRMSTGAPEIRPVVATTKAIKDTIQRVYRLDSSATADMVQKADTVEDIEVLTEAAESEDIDSVRRQTDAAPIVRLVNAILADGVKAGATDVHIEPQPMDLRVRYRVDGVLREALTLPRRVQTAVISRIKLISGLDIAEHRRPQDGRGRFKVGGQQIDMRVSTMPTMSGEKAVLRLLPKGDEFVGLEGLGFSPEQHETLGRYLAMPQGLIIFTGPTGSGKTTSMYAALQKVRGPDVNVVTLEDPIEYQMPWVNQVQIDDKIGLTFARGLRAILRQDPNIVLVGEVRDLETARICVQAAMTGHLVLSTLHTNDAPSAISRLIDMGVEPYLVASSLSLVVAQRLARRICERCAEPATPSDRTLDLLNLTARDLAGLEPRSGGGCASCSFTGYRKRAGIYEVLAVTHEIRDLISQGGSSTAIAVAARAAGMVSLRQSALEKVRAGETTFEEVVRTTHFDRDDTQRCPACRHEVERSFMACPYCRTALGARLCPTCARPAQPDWRGCPYCATPLEAQIERGADKQRVLVAVDDDAVSKRVKGALTPALDVTIVGDGDDAVRRAGQERPDVVILDLGLSGGAVDVLERLREGVATRDLPVVVLTDSSDETAEVECFRLGVDDVLRKPFVDEVLAARLAAVLRRAVNTI